MEEEEPEKVMRPTLFGLESEPLKVSLPQCTLRDAVKATRLQNARSRAENSPKVKIVYSIVTQFSAHGSFNLSVVDETEVDVAKTQARVSQKTEKVTCRSSVARVCSDRRCPCLGGCTLGKKTKNKKWRKIKDSDYLDRVLADLACRNPLDSVISAREVQETCLNVLHDDIPLDEVDDEPRWRRIVSVMDSGAADSVAPEDVASWIPVVESPGSSRGQHYLTASGDRLPNLGLKPLQVFTGEGNETTTSYQIADVRSAVCRRHVTLETWYSRRRVALSDRQTEREDQVQTTPTCISAGHLD